MKSECPKAPPRVNHVDGAGKTRVQLVTTHGEVLEGELDSGSGPCWITTEELERVWCQGASREPYHGPTMGGAVEGQDPLDVGASL